MESSKNQSKDKDKLDEAKPGDLIEFIRGPHYSHWAVYIGDGFVIHRWGDNDGVGQSVGFLGSFLTFSGTQFDKAAILQSRINDVLHFGGTARVNNYLDKKYKPLAVTDILDRARRCLNEEGYNVIFNNCEHFATECRYGEANSRQVQNVMIGSVIGTAAFLGIAFASISAFMKNGSDREKIDDVDSQEKSNKVHR